jgi:hypothetical protein
MDRRCAAAHLLAPWHRTFGPLPRPRMLRPIAEGRVAWSDPRLTGAWRVLALGAAVALLVFPRTVTVSDEAFYAGQALGLLHGHLVPTAAEPIPFPPGEAAEWVRYPFGWPLLLAPLRLLGFRALFAAPLAMHLLGGAAAARMLVRRGLPSWLAAAYLFHPVAWVFSRTLMSDVPAVALLLLAMDQWEQGRAGRGALALGYSLFARVGGAMAAAGVGLAVLAGRPRPRDVGVLALGCGAGGAAVMAMNLWALGSPLGDWYGGVAVGSLTGTRIPQHLALYAGGLLLLPPFPLACLLLSPRACDRWALAAVPTLAFFLLYAYHDQSTSPVETFLGGQRLILAAHVVLLAATMRAWAAIPLLRFRRAAVGLAAACAAGASLAWRWRMEDRFVDAVQAVRACRPRTLAYNKLALRVAAPVDARAYRLLTPADPGPPPAADVAVLALHEVTRSTVAVGRFEVPAALRAAPVRCGRAGAFLVFDLTGRCPLALPPCALPPAPRRP